MLCPNCGFQNQEGAKFCANCSYALSPDAGQTLPTNVPAAPPAPVVAYPPANLPAYAAPAAAPPYYGAPTKARSTALVLEILPGLFGLLGFGWIYAGETGKGVTWLIGFFIWSVVGAVIATLTAFIGCLCVLPISGFLIYMSASRLSAFAKSRPDTFTP